MKELWQAIRTKPDEEVAQTIQQTLTLNHSVRASELVFVAVEAASKGYVNTFKLLYRFWPFVLDCPHSNGMTPLHCAVTYKRLSMIKMLVEMGTRAAFLYNDHGKIPLELALYERDPEIILAMRSLYPTETIHFSKWIGLFMSQMQCYSAPIIEALYALNPDIIKLVGLRKVFQAMRQYRVRSIAAVETMCRLDSSIVDDTADETVMPMHTVFNLLADSARVYFPILHRYGSEAHFVKGASNLSPYSLSESDKRPQVGIYYFSRSLTEILFFALDSKKICSVQHTH